MQLLHASGSVSTDGNYYGISDGLDLREIPWRRGRGYDVEGLERLYTGNDAWARLVLDQLRRRIDGLAAMRALGFCVSIEHARFMARVFSEAGIAATAIWADTPPADRRAALIDLDRRRINVLFSIDSSTRAWICRRSTRYCFCDRRTAPRCSCSSLVVG